MSTTSMNAAVGVDIAVARHFFLRAVYIIQDAYPVYSKTFVLEALELGSLVDAAGRVVRAGPRRALDVVAALRFEACHKARAAR